MNILIIGSGAREHAVARAFQRSSQNPKLFCFGSSNNPGIKKLCVGYETGKIADPESVLKFALNNKIDLTFIGPEAPLSTGVADILWKNNIPCVGPKQKHAQLESSKGFTRDLQTKYNIPGAPKFKRLFDLSEAENFLHQLGEGNYVIKADGLMGGKGVKVAGDHLHNFDEALAYCQELITVGSPFVIEEKFIGQEFSLMSFCDGTNLTHMPVVQDHKRAFEGDFGPNTGGMGTYSDANHLLPFLNENDLTEAQAINQATADALRAKFGEGYKGILYGGFMITKDGVKLIEYNARLGDPEAMNVLAILESDFVALCQAIVNGNLTQNHTRFSHQATVCKYAVPEGYPDNPIKNQKINTEGVVNQEQLYFASVDERTDGLYEIGSRTVAVVGIADTIYEAEKIAEEEINKITGPLFHRKDIGTKELIAKRVEMMKTVR
ncbi:MAG: phosphoribosylamine--glycine ligase [Candidatus Magasanikbacteria bacterium]